MRVLLKVGFGLLLLAFLLIGLSYSVLRAQGVSRPASAEGRSLATDKRSVKGAINAIELEGPIDLTLRQGAVPSLEVRGEQRLLDNVATTVDGGVLHIGTTGMLLHHKRPLQVVLVLPAIERLKITGSGDSTVNGFSGERIEVQLKGSGSLKFNGRYRAVIAAVHGSGDLEMNGGSSDTVAVELKGSGEMTVVGACKQFKAVQSGSGELDAEHLTADQSKLELEGSGTAVLLAKNSADISVNGSGDVSVYGNPGERNIKRTGSGSVSFRH